MAEAIGHIGPTLIGEGEVVIIRDLTWPRGNGGRMWEASWGKLNGSYGLPQKWVWGAHESLYKSVGERQNRDSSEM